MQRKLEEDRARLKEEAVQMRRKLEEDPARLQTASPVGPPRHPLRVHEWPPRVGASDLFRPLRTGTRVPKLCRRDTFRTFRGPFTACRAPRAGPKFVRLQPVQS